MNKRIEISNQHGDVLEIWEEDDGTLAVTVYGFYEALDFTFWTTVEQAQEITDFLKETE